MNEHERPEDPAFDRLVAADPARRAPEPVEGVLRAKVDALLAGTGGPSATGGTPAPGGPSGPGRDGSAAADRAPGGPGRARRSGSAPGGDRDAGDDRGRDDVRAGDELAVRRQRRRAPWLVAAAVVGLVAVGGGGYLAGEAGGGSTPMSADMEVGGAPEPASGSPGDGGSGEPPSVLGMPERGAPADGGPDELPASTGVVFHAGVGLSKTPGTGEVRVAGTAESLGTYPVVSEVAAVERLGDPRFAGSVLRHGPDGGAAASGGAPTPGGAITWPVEDVTIVSADRTQARYTLPDGTVLLVPAYHLADAAGSSWTVLAVADELLDFAP